MRAAFLALALVGAPAAPPAPTAPLPAGPARVATALAHTTASLGAAIDAWQSGAQARSATPRDVSLWALHQQRLFLALTYDERLGRRAWPCSAARRARRSPPAGGSSA